VIARIVKTSGEIKPGILAVIKTRVSAPVASYLLGKITRPLELIEKN
jgi:hypothetical protein